MGLCGSCCDARHIQMAASCNTLGFFCALAASNTSQQTLCSDEPCARSVSAGCDVPDNHHSTRRTRTVDANMAAANGTSTKDTGTQGTCDQRCKPRTNKAASGAVRTHELPTSARVSSSAKAFALIFESDMRSTTPEMTANVSPRLSGRILPASAPHTWHSLAVTYASEARRSMHRRAGQGGNSARRSAAAAKAPSAAESCKACDVAASLHPR